MRLPSQRTAGAIGGASAVVLIVSMTREWYALKLPSTAGPGTISGGTYDAFQALERSDTYLVVAAAVGILFAGVLLTGVRSHSPAPALLLLAAGAFALALVVYRGISRPLEVAGGSQVETNLGLGWFIALLAAAFMALAGLSAYLRWLQVHRHEA
jgi:hypothetical protein